MVCKVCGRTPMNPEANFCDYCGASFREGVDNPFPDFKFENASTTNNVNETINAGEQRYQQMNSEGGQMAGGMNPFQTLFGSSDAATAGEAAERPMTFANWLVILLLPFIPLIGSFVYLGLLFVWSFGSKATKTKKNWARATLVVLVIAVFMLLYYFGGAANFMNTFGGIQ